MPTDVASHRGRRAVTVLALTACVLAAAACSGSSPKAAPATTAKPTTTVPPTTAPPTTQADSTTCISPGAPFAPSTAPPPTGQVSVTTDVQYGATHKQVLDIAQLPSTGTPRPAILLVHGGGWIKGDKRELSAVASQMAQAGFVTFDMNYTLARNGQTGYPNQVDQLEQAVVWIRQHAAQYSVDPARIGAFGGSAGATLVALLGVVPTGPCTTGSRVTAVVAWSGPMDLTALDAAEGACPAGKICDGINYPGVAAFVGCGNPAACPTQFAAASPKSHVGKNDPPMSIYNSSNEVIPVDQAQDMIDALTSAGTPHELTVVPGSRHDVQYAQVAMPSTLDFFEKWLG